ncbi:hypothetical protein JHK84_053323 [Glycine max]|nr:hypothetical protein JHK84_053323 [Glycine max]
MLTFLQVSEISTQFIIFNYIEGNNDKVAVYIARTKGQNPPTILDEHVLCNPPMDEGFPLGNYIPDLDFTTSRGTSNDAAKKEKKHETLKRKVHEGYQAHERGLKLRGTSDDAAKMEEKLETSKRKLHEGYQAHKRGLKLRRTSDDAAKMEEKIETSKRKPYEGNQEHERERRSTRYFEGYECHLPKGKHSRRSSRPKFSNRRRYN